VALWPGIPLIGLLVGIQLLNGILLPVILAFMLLLAGDRRLMGKLRNTRLQTVLGGERWCSSVERCSYCWSVRSWHGRALFKVMPQSVSS